MATTTNQTKKKWMNLGLKDGYNKLVDSTVKNATNSAIDTAADNNENRVDSSFMGKIKQHGNKLTNITHTSPIKVEPLSDIEKGKLNHFTDIKLIIIFPFGTDNIEKYNKKNFEDSIYNIEITNNDNSVIKLFDTDLTKDGLSARINEIIQTINGSDAVKSPNPIVPGTGGKSKTRKYKKRSFRKSNKKH